MKRKNLLVIMAIILGIFAVGCGVDNNTQSEETSEANESAKASDTVEDILIRVGYFSTPQCQTQLAIAKEKGFFDEEFNDKNVSIEYNSFAGSGPAINEAFLAGTLDVAHGIGDQPALSGIANGNGSVVLSRISKNARGGGVLVAYNSGINSISDLKGKRIGVKVGAADQKSLNLILKDAGIAESDVEVVNLKQPSDLLAAFESGEIDAAATTKMSVIREQAETEKIAKVLTDFSVYPTYTYLEFQNEFVEKHPDIAEGFTRALYKANQWYNENRDEGNQIVADFLGVDLDDVIVSNDSNDIEMLLDTDDEKNFQLTYDFLEDNEILPNEIVDLSVVYDNTVINKIINEN